MSGGPDTAALLAVSHVSAAPRLKGEHARARDRYLGTLRAASRRPVEGDPRVALDAFLSLNAAYFLGESLPARDHLRLVRRFAAAIDGLDGISAIADSSRRLQLAQHAREIAAAFDAPAWIVPLVKATEPWAVAPQQDWDAAVSAAVGLMGRDGGAAMLHLHASRRLWEMGYPELVRPRPSRALVVALRAAARAASPSTVGPGGGRAVQVVEAALDEAMATPDLGVRLIDAVTDFVGPDPEADTRPHDAAWIRAASRGR
jgi:hypothetical protein